MRKNKYTIVLTALSLMALSSCGDNEEVYNNGVGDPKTEIQITGTIDQHSQTRANDGGFVDQDAIGVYVVDYANGNPGELLAQGNHVTNMKFTYDASTSFWTGTSKIYWKDSHTPVDAYTYYPFREAVENPSAMPLVILPRQDKEDEKTGFSNYEASDVLWASAEKVEPGKQINFLFKHLMAGVEVRLIPGEGFDESAWAQLEKSVIIKNVLSEGHVDLRTGIITNVADSRINVVPFNKGQAYRAVILPQTLVANEVLFDITVDGNTYQFKRNEDLTFVGHKLHKFTIQVTQRLPLGDYEFTLMDEAVTAWEDDGISHGGEAREYVVVHCPAPGELRRRIEEAGYDIAQLYNLKITGMIDARDFSYFRDHLKQVEALNIGEVKITAWSENEADLIPGHAFYQCTKLRHIVFPEGLKQIGTMAFWKTNLTGALVIPEGVTHIHSGAFYNGDAGDNLYLNSLTLPSTLEHIGDNAFRYNRFNCELILPERLKYLGSGAFLECFYMYGELHLPSGLQEMPGNPFSGMSNLTGDVIIPSTIKKFGGFGGTSIRSIQLPDGLEEITGIGGKLRGPLYIPPTVKKFGRAALIGTGISSVNLPEGITEIPAFLLCGCVNLLDTIKIPSTVEEIGSGAFIDCKRVTAIIIPECVRVIGGDRDGDGNLASPFGGCDALNLIRCDAPEPPTLVGGVFNGVAKDNFTIEVPEGSVEKYRAAEGWKEFKRISAHNNFVCRPQFVNLLNKGHERDVILNAEGNWEVTYIPDWCKISAMSGYKKTQLKITIDELADGAGTRQDSIVFKLTDKDAITCYYVKQYDSEYKEDASQTLQKATRGQGIDLVFIGDGYDAGDIASGTYLTDMEQEVEYFFGVEPYATYRDYFNVYTAFAMSDDSGIGTLDHLRHPKFNTTIDACRLKSDYDAVLQYAVDNTDASMETLYKTTAILIPNTDAYEGICCMYPNGASVAVCTKSAAAYPMDARGVLQHEACGHAFGKLADEYMYHRSWIQTCPCDCCDHLESLLGMQSVGWGQNLSVTGRYKEIPWRHLATSTRYSDIVDIYEGGYFHTNGVYRSEYNSCMNNNVPYFSTWCRELITRRIKEYAGESFDFEDFVANDSREWGRDFTRSGNSQYTLPMFTTTHKGHTPILMDHNLGEN